MRLSLLPLHALLLLPDIVMAGEAPFVETALPPHAAAAETIGDAPLSVSPAAENTLAGRFLSAAKPKRKFCNTTQYGLKGDYAYEACGAFCKQAKAANHCKFCKCRACAFCKAGAAPTTAAPQPATTTTTTPAATGAVKRKSGIGKAGKAGKGGGKLSKLGALAGGKGGKMKKAKAAARRKLKENLS